MEAQLTIDVLTFVTILLAVASLTLSIAAVIFSWVTFNNTSKMQMDAHATLAKISERVEVIAQQTSHQMERVLEYFTRTEPTSEISKQVAERENELKEKLKEQVQHAITEAIKEAGLEKEKLDAFVSRVASLVSQITERTIPLMDKQRFTELLSEVSDKLNDYASRKAFSFPPNTPLGQMLRAGVYDELMKQQPTEVVVPVSRDLKILVDVQELLAKGKELSTDGIRDAIEASERLLRYFRLMPPARWP